MAGSCWCGRSESGICIGLHKFTEEEYQKFLKENKPFSEELLRDIKRQGNENKDPKK
jgi:hypothetical protein